MVAYITSTFNTGYIFGDAKGCFLANTTAGSIAASTNTNTNLATSCTLDSSGRTSSMTYSNGATSWTINDDTGSVAGYVQINLIGLTAGKNYELSMTVSSHGEFADGQPYMSRIDHNTNGTETYFSEWDFTYSSSKVLTGVFKAESANGDDFVMYTSNANINVTNFSVREVQEEDRSIIDCGMGVQGVITKSPCVTGSELMAYSGWSNSNYIYQAFKGGGNNSQFQFGTDPFYVSCWIKHTSAVGVYQGIVWYNEMFNSGMPGGWQLMMNQSDQLYFYWYGDSTMGSMGGSAATKIVDDRWHHVMVTSYSGGNKHKLYLDGVEVGSTTTNFGSVTENDTKLIIGRWAGNKTANYHFRGSIALVKLGSMGAGTELIREEKIKQIYQAEKQLFTPNAKCTLYGSSDDVTAIAYDDVQEVLHAGTSSGRSEFS